MSLLIDTTARLADVPPGTTITVVGTDDTTSVYTKGEDGRWTSEGKPAIRPSAFATAIAAGRVGMEADHKVGDWIHNAAKGRYYCCLRACHGRYTWAEVRNEVFQGLVSEATGTARTEVMPNRWLQAAEQGRASMDTELAQERLDQILTSGVIPVETEKTATVRVTGTRTVTPDAKQAADLLGDDAAVTATPTTLQWTKEYAVVKTSRWDCVCAEVTQADVDALSTPGEVTSWVVVGCE